MKKSSNGGYLKKDVKNCEIAHKYGSYEGNIHDFGICFAKKEYMTMEIGDVHQKKQ